MTKEIKIVSVLHTNDSLIININIYPSFDWQCAYKDACGFIHTINSINFKDARFLKGKANRGIIAIDFPIGREDTARRLESEIKSAIDFANKNYKETIQHNDGFERIIFLKRKGLM